MRRKRLASQILGTYAPDRFLITLPAAFGIVNPSDLTLNELDNDQLSVLFHEYVHYLQNIATPAGFHSFHRALDLYRLFRETVNPDCTSAGSKVMPEERQIWVRQYLSLADAFDGEVEPEWSAPDFVPDSFAIEACETTVREMPLQSTFASVTEVIVTGR